MNEKQCRRVPVPVSLNKMYVRYLLIFGLGCTVIFWIIYAVQAKETDVLLMAKQAVVLDPKSSQFQALVGEVLQNDKPGLEKEIVAQVLSQCKDENSFQNCLRILYCLIADRAHRENRTTTLLPPDGISNGTDRPNYSNASDRKAVYSYWEKWANDNDR